MNRYVIGDIHGGYIPFLSLLTEVNFNYKEDLLIVLGDVADGWPDTRKCFDLMLSITNLIYLRGNHEEWALGYYTGELKETTVDAWKIQGGLSTIKSLGDKEAINSKYIDLMNSSLPYYEFSDKGINRLFVHAGIPEDVCMESSGFPPLETVAIKELLWDRKMVKEAYEYANEPGYSWGERYDKIYVGHSPTIRFNVFYNDPQHWGNIWLMDTGASTKGRLSLMNIDTEEIWQSKSVDKLYPYDQGRNKNSYINIHS